MKKTLTIIGCFLAAHAVWGQINCPKPYVFTTIAGRVTCNSDPGYPSSENGYVDGVGTNAMFSFSEGLTMDAAGNLYIADTSGNCCIRKVTPVVSGGVTNWVVTTIAGKPGYCGTLDGIGTNALFNNPVSLTLDLQGNLYVVDGNQNTYPASGACIRKVTPVVSGGVTNWVVTTIAGIDAAGSLGNADGTGTNARFWGANDIVTDPQGNLYVTQSGYSYNSIREISPVISGGVTNWVVTTIAGQPVAAGNVDGIGTNAQFDFPGGITRDSNGNFFVTDEGWNTRNSCIREMTLVETNWVVTTIAGWGNSYNSGCEDGTCPPLANARFNNPQGITTDTNGNLYVADTMQASIRKITRQVAGGLTNWNVTTLAGTYFNYCAKDGIGTNAQFDLPSQLKVDNAGNVYVVDGFALRRGTPCSPPLTISPATPIGINVSWPDVGSYTLQCCENGMCNWTNAATNTITTANGTNNAVFAAPLTAPQMFYRLVSTNL
jgi:hypothetical protein